MENFLISVIVPVYNVEEYLNRCIESIVNQTYQNLEIILVDDGSPDNSPAICDEWEKKDNRIKVFHKENGGVSTARNVAISESSGEFLTFVDSDDWISKDTIEYLLRLCLSNNSDVASICTKTVSSDNFTEENNDCENIQIYKFEDIIKNYSNGMCYLCGKLYRKKLFENLPALPENLTVSEDAMLNYFVLKQCNKLVSSNLQKYYYFRHSESVLSGCITYRMINDSMKAYKIINDDFDKKSPAYIYQIYNTVMSDYFLINSIIRNKKCLDKYECIRKDILSYKKYIFSNSYKHIFSKKHIFASFLLLTSPKLYNMTVIIRTKIRGY